MFVRYLTLIGFFLFCNIFFPLFSVVDLGVDLFFAEGREKNLKNKRVGLVSNHTGVDKNLVPTLELLQGHGVEVVALFSPEHGWSGSSYAAEKITNSEVGKFKVYSLYGDTKRPTAKMLEGIDLLIYDIQDIGVRSYTYATTLFYVMEEAAKRDIPVIVFDRPNPINGVTIDGIMLDPKWRSFIGYINVPYCHGMTIGELANFFNGEYKIGCKLQVILMRGWKRKMTFADTGLTWVPTSPHIPEADSPLFYASTGILGELEIVNIGVGYTLPFKVIGAPWIDAELFAAKLNSQKLPGVYFVPFHYRPFYGSMKGLDCHGVLIRIKDSSSYEPLTVQYFLMGILKSLYPEKVNELLGQVKANKKTLFNKSNGTDEIYRLMREEQYISWKMRDYQKNEREQFKKIRERYLLY